MTGPELICPEVPEAYRVAFSTRNGGVSAGHFASLNIGLLSDDDRELVLVNRRRLVDAAGAHPELVSWPRQVHGSGVIDAGRSGEEADAIWTDLPGRALIIVTADCLPIALVRLGGKPAVALVHVGWRGLVGGVVPAAVAALGGRLLSAVIGPGIGACCYEVGEDVAAPVRSLFGFGLLRDGRLDLAAAAERALRDAGVLRVERMDECTACATERFFSHRRDAGRTGRQGAIAYVA